MRHSSRGHAAQGRADDAGLDLYLVRHGQTDWNLEKRLQGGTDNPLNETGRRQAAELAQRLAGVRFSHVCGSGLKRARETAAALAGSVPITPLASMNERPFGRFEGIYEDERSVAIVAHGGVNPLALAALLDIPVAEAVARIRQGNDEVYLVRLRKGQPPTLWKQVVRGTLEQL